MNAIVPVGAIGLIAISATGSARASGTITASGEVSTVDLTIFIPAEAILTGEVRFPDGSVAPNMNVFLGNADGGFLDATQTDDAGTFAFVALLPGDYSVRALDAGAGLVGDAIITVNNTDTGEAPAFVQVILGGTGSVSGTVFEQLSSNTVPVPGALVSGGTQIVLADDQGRYLIPEVPVGLRTITAASTTTGERGTRSVTILTAGQASSGIDIVLEPLGSVTGRVFDPNGQPIPGQEVRILIRQEIRSLSGARTFIVRKTNTDANGMYAFDQLELKQYTLMVVRGNQVANAKTRLSRLLLQDIVDLHLIRPTGQVSGQVIDETGVGLAAQVSISGLGPNDAGILEIRDIATTTSDPDNGFSFDGLFAGSFTVTASSFFSPVRASNSGTLPTSNSMVEGITLVLPTTTEELFGSLAGCVLTPEGDTVQPVFDNEGNRLPLSVFITSRLLRRDLELDDQNPEPDGIRVDASTGCFESTIPLRPDFYTLEVTDDRAGSTTLGQTAQAQVSVGANNETIQDLRLLGFGNLNVEIIDASGSAVPGAVVKVRRTTYPNDDREALLSIPTDIDPLQFSDLSEGPVSVSAMISADPAIDVGGRDDLRGFGGHAMGEIIREGLLTVRVTISAAGGVSGHFFGADGVTLVPNAQVELIPPPGGGMLFGVTDADGFFQFDGIGVGSFTLKGFDPATGRHAQASGRVDFDSQKVIRDMELGPIGTVQGLVLNADRSNSSPGAELRLTGIDSGVLREVTAGVDGRFVFESIPDGPFRVTAVGINGLSGQTAGTLVFEEEIVDLEVVLEGSGSVEGSVLDVGGTPIGAAQVTLISSDGRERVVQTSTNADSLGRFFFDVVPIGGFSLEARPLGALTPGDGGRSDGLVEFNGDTVDINIQFQGTVAIGVVVSGEVGSAPIEVSLTSAGLFGGIAAPTTNENGTSVFEGIPRDDLTISAQQITPIGTTISASASLSQDALPLPGERLSPDLQLALAEVGTAIGTIIDPDGQPVVNARITLRAGKRQFGHTLGCQRWI